MGRTIYKDNCLCKFDKIITKLPSNCRVVEGIKEKICRIEEENLTLHQKLVARSAELWDNLERLRQLGESIRDHKGM